jgi:phosphomannomutase
MSQQKTLMVSISGIRGVWAAGLDVPTLVKYAGAYAAWILGQAEGDARPRVVIGRDARVTGDVVSQLVSATLRASGIDVVDAGLATTPTVEMAVLLERADGGIIFSASHNPAEWNALKLLNRRGEFLTPDEATAMQALADNPPPTAAYDALGAYEQKDFLQPHIDAILALPYVDSGAIRARGFKIAVDGVDSVGGVAVPALLRALGVEDVICLNCEPTGRFSHNPEPLPQNLTGIIEAVGAQGCDLGIVVDPDADRLALVADGGAYVSEELTQVAAADFLWGHKSGPFATNLSSSRAIEDVARRHGQEVHRSAVGEINVVEKMKEVDAVLGGEGNGGVILPELHYGRDALAGVALVLTHLAKEDLSMSEWREQLPTYHMGKHKLDARTFDVDAALSRLAERYQGEGDAQVSTVDGVKIDLPDGWVHLRKSNTEPIVRVYTEAPSPEAADALAERFKAELTGE